MAELAAQTLVESGAESLSILNRTRERAEELAKQFDARAWGWNHLNEAVIWSDIVITSTAAPHAIIRPDIIRQVSAQRHHRPLFLIDIAVPRDVDPRVDQLEGVYLYDIDDLEAVVEDSLAGRRREVPKVEAIVRQAQEEFMAWYGSLGVVPTIVDIRKQAHTVREAELERALRRLKGVSDHDQEIIQMMTERIVNKILHHPTVCLKKHASRSDGYQYTEVARDLFGVDGKEDQT
jgi:glutamyl-tRNA reductase